MHGDEPDPTRKVGFFLSLPAVLASAVAMRLRRIDLYPVGTVSRIHNHYSRKPEREGAVGDQTTTGLR